MRSIFLLLVQWIINHFFSTTRFFEIKRWLLNQVPGIELAKGVKVVGPIHITAMVSVKENTWIGNHFSVEGNGHVTIGSCCDVAPSVIFFTGTHEIGDSKRRAGRGINKNVVVGNGCWICGASRILPGTKIGDGVVVAAGSIVNKNVPDNVLVGGCPAQIIKHL